MPEIELLTVANHAEAINGLLYLSGAGWTDHFRAVQPNGQPGNSHIGIGLAILVPWVETNRRHHIVVRIENEDGKEQFRIEGDLELGRPAGVPEGSDLRSVVAVNGDLQFKSPGIYRVVATIAEHTKKVVFRVHDLRQAMLQAPS